MNSKFILFLCILQYYLSLSITVMGYWDSLINLEDHQFLPFCLCWDIGGYSDFVFIPRGVNSTSKTRYHVFNGHFTDGDSFTENEHERFSQRHNWDLLFESHDCVSFKHVLNLYPSLDIVCIPFYLPAFYSLVGSSECLPRPPSQVHCGNVLNKMSIKMFYRKRKYLDLKKNSVMESLLKVK